MSSQAKPVPANDSRSWGLIQSPLQFLGRPTDFSELWLSLQGGRRGYSQTRLCKEEGAGRSAVFIQVKPICTCLREQPQGDLQALVPSLQLQSKDFILRFCLHKQSLWDNLNSNFWVSLLNTHSKGYPSLQQIYVMFFSPDTLDPTSTQANRRIRWPGSRPAFHHFSTDPATDKHKSFDSKLHTIPLKKTSATNFVINYTRCTSNSFTIYTLCSRIKGYEYL